MNQHSEDETELRRYLLGELTQEERSQVEERLFLDSSYFHDLQAVEDDLVDDYVYEELSVADRERFETIFLSEPGHREDLKIAQALRKYIASKVDAAPQTSLFIPADRTQPRTSSNVVSILFFRNFSTVARLSLATAALIILSIGIWLIIKVVRNQSQSQPIQVQRPTPQGTVQTPQHEEVTTNSQPDKSPQVQPEQRAGQGGVTKPEERQVAGRTGRDATPPDKPSSQGGEPLGRAVAFLLIPGTGVRGGGGINKLSLSANDRLVNLQLALVMGNAYRSYHATLLSDNTAIRTWPGLKPVVAESGDLVSVIAPAKLFSQKNYQIKLSGITADGKTRDVAAYDFQVEKK